MIQIVLQCSLEIFPASEIGQRCDQRVELLRSEESWNFARGYYGAYQYDQGVLPGVMFLEQKQSGLTLDACSLHRALYRCFTASCGDH